VQQQIDHTGWVVLFDGVCNLCSNSVQFIIERDAKAAFKFASLQSAFGQYQLEKFNLDKNSLYSIILIKEDNVYQQSDAALRIAKELNGGWPVFYMFIILPRFIRDTIYNLIAQNRYRLFGKKEACWIPTPELQSRFISNVRKPNDL
jgi:predicted DCC family thiol-disulfide oxidoreductase YuxK